MAGPDRTIGVLKLFTLDRPAWTVEEAAVAMRVSTSSAYRYFASLTEAGLLTTVASGRYTLGPAIIQYDYQIQLTDPLLRVAKPVMSAIQRLAPPGSMVLLCRLFREQVLCMHQVSDAPATAGISYERGRPMPLFRGATSTIILAHLSSRELRRLYNLQTSNIGAAGLGNTWEAFRTALSRLRKAGHAVTRAAVDPGRMGVAAPILDEGRRVLGSLSYVIPVSEDGSAVRLASIVTDGAREIEAGMRVESCESRPAFDR